MDGRGAGRAEVGLTIPATFSLKYPSLLQFEQDARGLGESAHEPRRENLRSLFGVERTPSDVRLCESIRGGSAMVIVFSGCRTIRSCCDESCVWFFAPPVYAARSTSKAAALGLGLPADRFTRWFDAPLTNMTLLRYPETGKERWGIHPHKDFDVLTLLAHDPVGGLQVLARDGEWLDAACPEDGFLVNAGDMLELWSGGRIRSAPHRVLNRSGRERVSFPWFAVPEPEVTIEPLLPPVPGFAREPLNCAEASAAVWYSNWPDAAPPSGITLGEFGDHPREAERDTGQGNAAGGATGATSSASTEVEWSGWTGQRHPEAFERYACEGGEGVARGARPRDGGAAFGASGGRRWC